MMLNVADVVAEFPQASLAVKVTVVEPVPPHKGVIEMKLLLQLTVLQLSIATTPACELNQVASELLVSDEQSTDKLPALGLRVNDEAGTVNTALLELV